MEYSFERYENMSSYQRAKLVLAETYGSLTIREKYLLAITDYEVITKPLMDVWERSRLLTFIDGLKSVIAKNENFVMPDPKTPVKVFEPTRYRND